MVVGNGLMAKAFTKYKEDDSIVIFASGVSNSSQTSMNEFDREKALLLKYLSQKSKLVYFSTCSLSDKSISDTQYILHKHRIEELIQRNQDSYIIFRLPIIVGKSKNPNTLTNFFYNSIMNSHAFQTYANSCRYLMDIEDAAKIISRILEKNYFNSEIVNITFNNRIKVTELVEIFEKLLGVQARHELVNKGSCYEVDNSKVKEVMEQMNLYIDENYNYNLIQKYYSAEST